MEGNSTLAYLVIFNAKNIKLQHYGTAYGVPKPPPAPDESSAMFKRKTYSRLLQT